MPALTPSGEVAAFLDDDQFAGGQSQYKCGPESVSVFWHSVAPGQHNPYTGADIHNMAAADYVKFIGADVASDMGGTSQQTLYDMLAFHKFAYKIGPAENVTWVKQWLDAGYPSILLIQESSVEDLALGRNPYNWDTSGLLHFVVASGAKDTGELLCRDTANIGPSGVRPGPRRYNASRLQILSATMVIPSWMPLPDSAMPPVVTPAQIDYKKMAQDALATLTTALQHLQ